MKTYSQGELLVVLIPAGKIKCYIHETLRNDSPKNMSASTGVAKSSDVIEK